MRTALMSLRHWVRAVMNSEIPGIVMGFVVIEAAFGPGLLTPDSASMLSQADSGQISDWLSPAPTWLLRTFNVNGAEWFVLTTMAFLIVTSRILARGFSRLLAGVVAAIVACSPPVLGWLSALGRDTWCGIALLAAVLLAIGPRPISPVRRVVRAAGLVVALAMALCARQNAALAVFGIASLAVFPMTRPGARWKRLLVAGGASALVTAALAGGQSLFIARVVHPTRTYPEQATYVSDLAAMSLSTGQRLVPDVVWNAAPDYEHLEAAWNDAAGTAIYNVADPPVRTVASGDTVRALRSAWVRSIAEHPWAYLKRRARVVEIQLFESTQLGDPFVPGMVGSVPGHELARPTLARRVIDLQDAFWRMSGLRVWHLLVAGLAGAWFLRRTPNASLAVGLQVTSWLIVVSLIPTAPGSDYRFTWLPATAALLTVALAVAHRWPRLAGERSGPGRSSDGATASDPAPQRRAENRPGEPRHGHR